LARLATDVETDGFLENVTKIHCAVMEDVDTGAVRSFTPHYVLFPAAEPLEVFLEEYQKPEHTIIGQNFIKFDYEVIKKLHGVTIPHERILDTMILGRLIFPDIKQDDFVRAAIWRRYLQATEAGENWLDPIPLEFPGNCIGLHSLKAWGYRIGEHKGDYDGGWENWSPEMHSYMLQDASVTANLFRRFMAREPSQASVTLEHRIAWLCAQIERNGFPFDVKAATELYGRLVDERETLRRELIGLFPNWRERLPDFIPKRPNKTLGYLTGVPVERWKEHEFNPTSRDHIADRLKAKYDWKPMDFTDGGKATVDDEVLAGLPYPEAKPLARYFLLDKRIGAIAEGKGSWLNLQREGKIHAAYNTNGTPHGRASHSKPNISAVPKLSTELGRECRALFTVPPGWVLVGADQQGIQLRCLASDLKLAGDEGRYANVVLDGDPHTANQLAAGLATRDNAKTFIYAFLFGGQGAKIGSIAGGGAGKGRALIKAFTERTPGLKTLIETCQGAATGKGWLKGIDGRRIPIRSAHSALNYRLASQEAVICKRWGCDAEELMVERGLVHGWEGDFAFVSWSHDEYQVAVRDDPGTIATVRQCLTETGRAAGDDYNFQCPLDVETKVGRTWAETH